MKNKGISLVVLIITIVVVLILTAAIVLNIKDANLIGSANSAVIKTDIKTFEEELSMYVSNEYAKTLGEFEKSSFNADKTTNPSVYDVLTSLEKSKYKDNIIIKDGKIVIGADASNKVKVNAKEISNIIVAYNKVQIGEKAEDNNSVVTGQYPSYNNPVIPVGFKPINTPGVSWDDSNKDGIVDDWNKGLVIQDDDLNQFVWVPCSIDGANGTIKYMKNLTYPSRFEVIASNIFDNLDAMPDGVKEQEQIRKYGGFYIGRYEATVCEKLSNLTGLDVNVARIEGKPTVKSNTTIWAYLSSEMATSNAKLFIDTENVKSGIVTGTAWDTICEWIASEKDENGNSVHSILDSTTWGNYHNDPVDGRGEYHKSGYSDSWKAKNIYDFAGSTWEWTSEKRIDTNNVESAVMRGGHDANGGDECPASYRYFYGEEQNGSGISFRIQLYIM